MFCKQCGVQIKPGAHFCTECGAVLSNAGATSKPKLVRDKTIVGLEQEDDGDNRNNPKISDENHQHQLSTSTTSLSSLPTDNTSAKDPTEEAELESFQLTESSDRTRSGFSKQRDKFRKSKAGIPVRTNWWLVSTGILVSVLVGYLGYSSYKSNHEANQMRLELEQNAMAQQREIERLNQEKKVAEEQAELERRRREEADRQEQETKRRMEQEALAKKQAEENANRLLQAKRLKEHRSQEESALANLTREKETEAKRRYEQTLVDIEQKYSNTLQMDERNYQDALAKSILNPLRIVAIEQKHQSNTAMANNTRNQLRAKAQADYQQALENIKQYNYHEKSRIENNYSNGIQ